MGDTEYLCGDFANTAQLIQFVPAQSLKFDLKWIFNQFVILNNLFDR